MKTKLSIVNYQLSILLILAAFLAPMKMRADTAAQLVTSINNFAYSSYGTGKFTATASGNTVTVNGGFANNSAYPLPLNIDGNVTVLWLASATTGGYNSGFELINLSGSGTFEVATGGEIKATPTTNRYAIRNNGVSIKINGGTVTGNGTYAISSANGSVTVAVGTVSCTNGAAIYSSGGTVTVSGGIISSSDNIALSSYNSNITVNGGTISSSGNTAINAYGGTVTVSSGTVSSSGSETIYLGGSAALTVSGTGLVQATDQNGLAIHSFGNNTVEVKDNAQISATAGTAILAENSASSTITIGGSSKVQSQGSYTIKSSGNVEIKDNAQVSATTGTAISVDGTASVVNVSGGTVTTDTGNGIYASVTLSNNSKVTISGGTVSATGDKGIALNTINTIPPTVVSGGTVSATTGAAINGFVVTVSGGTVSATTGSAIYGSNITVSGGTVSSTSGRAIYTGSSSNKVTVSGTGIVKSTSASVATIDTYGSVEVKDNAQVSSTSAAAISATYTSSTVAVSGGTVSAGTGNAIYTTGTNSTVAVSGGTVKATTGYAIYSAGASSKITVDDGLVFAYGSSFTGSNGVIRGGGFTNATATGVVIAWDEALGNTTYTQGDANDLSFSPTSATVRWDMRTVLMRTNYGIYYANGANTGFISLSVTVIAATMSVSTNSLNFAASGGTQTIGVTSNAVWAAKSSDETWLNVSPTRGRSNGSITVTANSNTSTTKRTATIVVTSADGTAQTVTVTQDASATAIEAIDAPDVNIYSQAGNVIVDSKTVAIKTVSVYGLSGQLLKTVEPESNRVSIPQSFSSSILIVRVEMNNKTTATKKLIINR